MAVVDITFPGNLAQVATAADLRAVPTLLLSASQLFLVRELSGVFEFDGGSILPDNGIDVIRPNDRLPLQAGRWLFQANGLAPGPTGPANSTYTSLSFLKAAPATNKSYILADGVNPPVNYAYVSGDFTGKPDDINVVALNGMPITTGALVRQVADSLTYTLPSVSAKPQGQAEKNALTVDVFDALTPAMRSAMRGGSYIDVGPAIDAICNYAAGGENTGTVGGVTLYFKGGRYSSSVPLRNTIRFDKSITDDGDCRRMNLCGDGSANTMFFYQGDPSVPAYSVKGYNSGEGQELYHVIEGLRIRRQFDGTRGQGIGVKLLNVANIEWRDTHVDGFNVGIDAEGVLGWLAQNLFVLGNNGGILARVGTGFTRPNVWQFLGGAISGSSVYGAQFTDAANIGFVGTRFEANGADDSAGNKTNQFVLRMIGAPAEGGSWLDLANCYFENNNVETEVSFSTSAASVATIGIRGTSFQRISDTRNPNRHVDFAATAGKVLALIDATAFRTIGARTPSSAFKAWRNQSANTIVTTNSVVYESSLEGPDTGNFPLIGNDYPILDVLINTDGSYNLDPMITKNVREVTKGTTGKYTVYFKTSPADAASVRYTAVIDGNTGFATITFKSAGGVDIETRNAAGVLTDLPFVIIGFGRFG